MYKLIVSDGTGQNERSYPAHEENYFNVDEMGFSDLLALAGDFAEMVDYFDLRNERAGDWRDYLMLDETLVIAGIQASRVGRLQAEFREFLELAGASPRLLRNVSDPRSVPPCMLAKCLNDWFVRLQRAGSPAAVDLRGQLATLVRMRLGQSIFELRTFLAEHTGVDEQRFLRDFDPIWFDATPAFAEAGEATSRQARLTKIFNELLSGVEVVRRSAARLLVASLEDQNHDPGAGLLLVFLQLYKKSQQRLNRFTQRHLDFYHDEVLGMRSLKPNADRAFLTFKPNPRAPDTMIGKDTEFLAGRDEQNRDIVFKTDGDLLVNAVDVGSLCTLHFERNRLSSPENQFFEECGGGERRQFPTGSSLRDIPANGLQAPDRKETTACYPLFGAPRSDADYSKSTHARIGFALSSKVLMLAEGRRDISVSLQFAEGGLEDAETLETFIDRLAQILSTSRQDAFIKAFREMFKIGLTAEGGWLEVPDYVPLHAIIDDGCPANTLVLRVELAPAMPAVVPYSRDIHGEDYATACPVMRFVVNHDNYLFPYGFLKKLVLKSCEIRVTVSGCRNLNLSNNLGALAANVPFSPFGPIPAVGSYMIVGNAEAFAKNLKSLDLDIEWGGLPSAPGGFKTHYQGYGVEIDNQDFVADLSVLSNGKWFPAERSEQARTTLFEDAEAATGICGVSRRRNIALGPVLPYYRPSEGVGTGAGLAYRTSSKNGFFKLTLVEPKFGFGHAAYPNVLADALIFNARIKVKRLARIIPPAPYTPQIDSISLNYSAVSEIHLENLDAHTSTTERFIHLHPLGWETISPTRSIKPFLFPQYEYAGNLFIGLQGIESVNRLSLLFHLNADAYPAKTGRQSKPSWFYLSGNAWKRFDEREIVSDSTRGFQTSGIVVLELPRDLVRSSTVMPPGCGWLRLSANEDLEGFCSLLAVCTQAVQIRRDCDQDTPYSKWIKLAAGSRISPRQTLPGIRAINLIADSFGGRDGESRRQMRTRVSERLKHKNRAIAAWDYERLILERFPDIAKVKCFANMVRAVEPSERIRPGHVLIAALPKLPGGKSADLKPMLNGHELQEIKDFVAAFASPFASIEVCNPAYERIQIRCAVKLSPGLAGGYYLQMLNRALSGYISPWTDTGYPARFGWRIRRHDMQAFLLSFDCVETVSKFSMLNITETGADDYRLFDTAAFDSGEEQCDDIIPRYPWSMPIPSQNHFIETMSDLENIPAEKTALGALEIGSTLIIT